MLSVLVYIGLCVTLEAVHQRSVPASSIKLENNARFPDNHPCRKVDVTDCCTDYWHKDYVYEAYCTGQISSPFGSEAKNLVATLQARLVRLSKPSYRNPYYVIFFVCVET